VGQVQAGILAFFVIDVDGDFLGEMQGLAVGGLEAFQVGPEDVVGLACGNALGKLAMMVGVDLPADFLGLSVARRIFTVTP